MMIVGGYIRDLLMGRQPRDVDILLPRRLEAEMRLGAESMSGSGSGSMSDSVVLRSGSGGSSSTSLEVGELDIQFTEDPEAHIERYSIGLCKVGWSPSRGLIVTRDFLTDLHNRTLTFRPQPQWSEAKTLDHLSRVQAKYPDHEVVFA